MRSVTVEFLGKSVITIDDVQLTPASAHLFGLVLLVADARGRVVSRRQLQQLLFPPGESAAHPLRQLLYRARQLGVSLTSDGDRLVASRIHVETSLDRFEAMGPSGRAALTPDQLRFLPGWEPQLPPPFVDWLAIRQDEVHTRLITVLTADFAQFRRTSDWASASRVGRLLSRLVPLDERLACQWAEALHMIGRSAEGMAALDQLLEEETASVTFHEARALRKRLERLPSRSRSSPLVGRQDCLAFLRGELEQLDHERGGRVCVLVGPPGIGKTRMGEEFGRSLEVAGTPVLYHRCDSRSRLTPLSLFSQLLRQLTAMRGSIGASPANIALLDKYLTSLDIAAPLPEGVAIERLRADLHSAIVDLMEAVSSEKRFVIVIDDAHLLDDASMDEVRSMATDTNAADMLIVAGCRPTPRLTPLVDRGRRVKSYLVTPLTTDESRQLLLNVIPTLYEDEGSLLSFVQQGAGNPFHLLAIATQVNSSSLRDGVLLDVHSLASSTYLALSADVRQVLESCILLGRLATVERVEGIANIDTAVLLRGLRELEELGLLTLDAGLIRGPHALLEAAILSLAPQTVLASLRSRLASTLELESNRNGFTPTLLLAAAEALVANGDHMRAVPLLQQCAAAAARFGEPTAATEILAVLSRESLPPSVKRDLLDLMAEYAENARAFEISVIVLKERLALSHAMNASAEEVASVELRLANWSIQTELSSAEAREIFTRVARNDVLSPALRSEALLQLMMSADAEYDQALALHTLSALDKLEQASSVSLTTLRARLVYHTGYGRTEMALGLIDTLLIEAAGAGSVEDAFRLRRFCCYALYRLSHFDRAMSLTRANYQEMLSHGLRTHAMIAASLMIDLCYSLGNIDGARGWFHICSTLLVGRDRDRVNAQPGYCGHRATLLMLDGQYEAAQRSVEAAMREDRHLAGKRYRAACYALTVRAAIMMNDLSSAGECVAQLEALYDEGKSFGSQDSIVEALWGARVLAGNEVGASTLLRDYLASVRREPAREEWALVHTTGADVAWSELGQIGYARLDLARYGNTTQAFRKPDGDGRGPLIVRKEP